MVHSISKEELLEAGCLHAGKLDEAFALYRSAFISANNESDMLVFIRRLYSVNEGAVFADFYYPALDAQSQERFRACLNGPQLKMAEAFQASDGQVYYPLEEERMLDFLVVATARNWLFSTFYFADKKAMLWGNYDLKFPIFCEDEANLQEYMELAKVYGLECHK